MFTPHVDTSSTRRLSLSTMDELLHQLAVRDAAIAQLEQRCVQLSNRVAEVEAELTATRPVVELATQYICATDAATSGSTYLKLRRAVAERARESASNS